MKDFVGEGPIPVMHSKWGQMSKYFMCPVFNYLF